MKIIFYGDSNTYGYDPRRYTKGRYDRKDIWTSLVSAKLGDGYRIENEGLNGRCLPGREEAYSYIDRLLSGMERDDLFVIMLGTNDILRTSDPDAKVPVGRMDALLRRLTARIECPRLLIIAPPVIGAGSASDPALLPFKEQSILMNEGFREAAQKYGVPFADAAAWNVELSYDGVHFSEEGHRTFAKNLLDRLRSVCKQD